MYPLYPKHLKPVEVLARDSGDVTTTTIEASIADLVTTRADVLVGPSSSVLAERVFPKIVAAKLPMISPAATPVRLAYTASKGYLFRTIGSAALEGDALAQTIGAEKARMAIVHFDDDMGRAVLSTIRAALTAPGGLVEVQTMTAATTDPAPIVAAVKAATPDDVVFVCPFSAMDKNTGMITQLTAAGLGGAKLWLTGQNTADYSQALPVGTMTNVRGLLEGAQPTVALAAQPRSCAGCRSGGIECTTYRECLDVLKASSDIDDDAVSRSITFGTNGDTNPAHFGLYRYDAAGRVARVGDIIAG